MTEPVTPALRGPWLVLALGLTVAVAAIMAGQTRAAGYLIAGSLATIAVLRAVRPTSAVGAIAVRSRTTDVLLLLLAAGAMATLTATLRLD
jgi:hypothetical protein